MPKTNNLEYVEIGGEIKTKTKKSKPIDTKKVKKILNEIRDSVIDYVPESHL